jgi:hypothetical protein
MIMVVVLVVMIVEVVMVMVVVVMVTLGHMSSLVTTQNRHLQCECKHHNNTTPRQR